LAEEWPEVAIAGIAVGVLTIAGLTIVGLTVGVLTVTERADLGFRIEGRGAVLFWGGGAGIAVLLKMYSRWGTDGLTWGGGGAGNRTGDGLPA
jgi:hypothetical protein